MVGLEIERRFLVTGTHWRQHVSWVQRLHQGYLVSSAEGFTVRVRLQEASPEGSREEARRAWLTLKAAATGIARHEFEYLIPPDDAEQLLSLTSLRLSKCRYGLDLPGGDWVLDVFEGDNAPLVLAEVELEREDAVVPVPFWCRREITGRGDLSNAALARSPLAGWPAPRRAALWEGQDPAARHTP